jgi:hypothetical protein
MHATTSTDGPDRRTLLLALAAAYLWLNVSEVFRYFAFVMPMMRHAMASVPDVAPMNITVFLIWGLWDTLLFVVVAIIAWLCHERFGGGLRHALGVGTLLWATIFCVFWIAAWNMNLTAPRVLLVALPLAWIEMVVVVAILERAWPHVGAMSKR